MQKINDTWREMKAKEEEEKQRMQKEELKQSPSGTRRRYDDAFTEDASETSSEKSGENGTKRLKVHEGARAEQSP